MQQPAGEEGVLSAQPLCFSYPQSVWMLELVGAQREPPLKRTDQCGLMRCSSSDSVNSQTSGLKFKRSDAKGFRGEARGQEPHFIPSQEPRSTVVSDARQR